VCSSDLLREAKARGAAAISKIYYFEKVEKNDTVSQQIYGIGKMELESFSSFDYEKLRSGNYLIVSNKVFGSVSVPNVGDMVKLVNTESETREFEVIAVIDEYPLSLSSRFIIYNSLTCILADDIFLEFFGEHQPMQANLTVAPDKIAEIEAWMNEYTTRIEPNLDFISRRTLKGEFERLQTTYVVLGGFLAFVLALIGVLNFTNAMVASILARRREFAILQSIGMTGKQLRRTLIFEGCGYTALTAVFTMTIGLGLTYLVTLLIAGQVWFFRQSVTILPSIMCLPLLFALCAAIPVVCCSKLCGESIVDRLRVE
jgi:putative ABC transport system permease protein